MPCKRTVSLLCCPGTLVTHSLLSSRAPRSSSVFTAIQPLTYTSTGVILPNCKPCYFPWLNFTGFLAAHFSLLPKTILKAEHPSGVNHSSPVLYHVRLEYTLNSVTQGNKVEAKENRTLGTPLGIGRQLVLTSLITNLWPVHLRVFTHLTCPFT